MAKKSVIRKDWYEVIAPETFNEKKVGETPADEEEKVIGRQVRIGVKDVMPSSNKYYMNLFFKIDEINSERAVTKLVGHRCSKEYLSRLIRRRTKKLEYVKKIETFEEEKVKIGVIAITLKKPNTSALESIRKKIDQVIDEKVKDLSYSELIKSILENKIQKETNNKVKKIYPLRSIEFKKSELIES